MNKDMHLEQQEAEFEEAKNNQIEKWVSNGADPIDAAQLWDDMINDPWNADPDMDVHSDTTIDDRIKEYSAKE